MHSLPQIPAHADWVNQCGDRLKQGDVLGRACSHAELAEHILTCSSGCAYPACTCGADSCLANVTGAIHVTNISTSGSAVVKMDQAGTFSVICSGEVTYSCIHVVRSAGLVQCLCLKRLIAE